MPDFDHIRELCQKRGKISKTAIDEFIIYYAARRDKLADEFDTRISRFKEAVKELQSSWIGLLKAQYIGHQVFKQNGLITKYLNHSAIKELDVEQQNYLRQMAAHPWRFSFSEIIASPARDFYEMENVFTAKRYLLYSPSVSQILSERPVLLWFNLIGFNGDCWETYGPVTGFQSFDDDDIFFYATELNRLISSEADLLKDVENNPVPYMMLVTGSAYPRIQHQAFEVVQVTGEGHSQVFNMQKLKKEFRIEYAEGVFKLTHERWSEPPHYAEAYYEEAGGIIFLSAFTDTGYLELAESLNAYEFNVPVDPDVRLHWPMLTVIKKLLKKDVSLNPYSSLFEVDRSAASDLQMKKLNDFMSRALPYINAGKQPDIEELAKETGVDPEVAKELFKNSMDSIQKLRK